MLGFKAFHGSPTDKLLTIPHNANHLLTPPLQGTGQIGYGIPSGDGFVTDAAVINSFKGQTTKTTRYSMQGEAAGRVQACDMMWA